jgi:hypothetical protein
MLGPTFETLKALISGHPAFVPKLTPFEISAPLILHKPGEGKHGTDGSRSAPRLPKKDLCYRQAALMS